jgi:2'-5' RNA ligase
LHPPGTSRTTRAVKETYWRTFCAIELPAELSSRAASHITRLRTEVPQISASWNRDGKFHITLKFLGEIPQRQVKDVSEAADRAVGEIAPFKIIVEQAGVFPKHGPPRILWIGITDSEGKLQRLQARLDDECAKQGFAKEDRPFHPHLTLARLRRPEGARTLALKHKELGFEPVVVNVSELLVFRSELGQEGSKYTVISRHSLNPVTSGV